MSIATTGAGERAIADQHGGIVSTTNAPPNRRIVAKPDQTLTPEPR